MQHQVKINSYTRVHVKHKKGKKEVLSFAVSPHIAHNKNVVGSIPWHGARVSSLCSLCLKTSLQVLKPSSHSAKHAHKAKLGVSRDCLSLCGPAIKLGTCHRVSNHLFPQNKFQLCEQDKQYCKHANSWIGDPSSIK